MEATKVARLRTNQAPRQEPKSQDDHMSRGTQAQRSDATDRTVRNREDEEPTENAYGRKRQSLT